MTEIFVVLGIVAFAFVISIPWRGRRSDPMDQGPVVHKPVTHSALKINQKLQNPEWAAQFVHHVATSGAPNSMTDESVRQGIYEIVNNDDLSDNTKYHLLDALQMRVWNDHPDGMAAGVIEDIENESVALQCPNSDWHGRHGDWDSVKGR